MDFEKFTQRVNVLLEESKEVLKKKGADYTKKSDRLSNFKEQASRLHLHPFQIWSVYFSKHMDAVFNFCSDHKLESEPIRSRIIDAINYLLLLDALICDVEGVKFFNKEEFKVMHESFEKVFDSPPPSPIGCTNEE